MAYHNKLLTQDALEFTVAEEPMLHQSVLKLLPTLHGLLYAIDVQDLINAGEDKLEEEYQFLRSELSLMLAGSFQRVLYSICFYSADAFALLHEVLNRNTFFVRCMTPR